MNYRYYFTYFIWYRYRYGSVQLQRFRVDNFLCCYQAVCDQGPDEPEQGHRGVAAGILLRGGRGSGRGGRLLSQGGRQHLHLILGPVSGTYTIFQYIDRRFSSVADPNPDRSDTYVFGPPGSGYGSISKRYGSGSFYHQVKTEEKP
jgi:hypothetical protein